jgi:uncharacterized protein
MITNYKGNKIDFLNIKEEDICIEDIINALPNICRYGGRLRNFYSVAQHSVELSRYLRHINKQYLCPLALLHDGLEAYVGDIVYPVKENFPEFLTFEEALTKVVFSKYNIDIDLYKEFSYYDRNIVVNEMKMLGLWEKEKQFCTKLFELPELNLTEAWYPDVARDNFKQELVLVMSNILP